MSEKDLSSEENNVVIVEIEEERLPPIFTLPFSNKIPLERSDEADTDVTSSIPSSKKKSSSSNWAKAAIAIRFNNINTVNNFFIFKFSYVIKTKESFLLIRFLIAFFLV